MTLNMVIAASRAATDNWTILLMAIRAGGRVGCGWGGEEGVEAEANTVKK